MEQRQDVTSAAGGLSDLTAGLGAKSRRWHDGNKETK